MTEPTTDVIQGTLDMLILKTLSLAPLHGYGIARRIEQISRGVFKVAGRRQLSVETESWQRRVGAMSRLLRAES